MELILVNNDKFKVVMSKTDMKLMNFKNNCKGTILRILDIAKENGFDTESKKIYVQAFLSKCGECEMYISKKPFFRKVMYISEKSIPIIRLCRLLKKEKSDIQGDIFYYRKHFCLLTCNSEICDAENVDVITDEDFMNIVSEHGKKLIKENAVNVLSQFFI